MRVESSTLVAWSKENKSCIRDDKREELRKSFIVLPFYFRYYSLDVSYFKSSLDKRLLDMLWNKYWVNTLSSSTLLTVSFDQNFDVFTSKYVEREFFARVF